MKLKLQLIQQLETYTLKQITQCAQNKNFKQKKSVPNRTDLKMLSMKLSSCVVSVYLTRYDISPQDPVRVLKHAFDVLQILL